MCTADRKIHLQKLRQTDEPDATLSVYEDIGLCDIPSLRCNDWEIVYRQPTFHPFGDYLTGACFHQDYPTQSTVVFVKRIKTRNTTLMGTDLIQVITRRTPCYHYWSSDGMYFMSD